MTAMEAMAYVLQEWHRRCEEEVEWHRSNDAEFETWLFDKADKAESEEAAAASTAVEYIGTYVALQQQIAALTKQADEAKQSAREALGVDSAPVGKVWEFPGLATVTKVKGRVTEKLDRAKLARAGVAQDVLDAATVRSEGEPSLRIASDLEG